MKKVFISDMDKHLEQEVKIQGWIHNFRSSGSLYFLQIRDGSGFIQAIVSKNDIDEKLWKECEKITQETSIELEGKVSKHPKKEEYEIQVNNFKLLQIGEEYPISNKEHGEAFRLDNRHLWLRSKKQ